SPKTVESHKYNILKKMEIDSIGELIRYAIRKKIIKP
ncbi:MAG: DNA-binding response regulator, partial [Deltaproteobacteria bacterium]